MGSWTLPLVQLDSRPTMGNGDSGDQGDLPSYGKRDVRTPSDRKQHDWSELARAPTEIRCRRVETLTLILLIFAVFYLSLIH